MHAGKFISWLIIFLFYFSVRYQTNHVVGQEQGTSYEQSQSNPNVLTENGYGVMGPGSNPVQAANLERVMKLSYTMEKLQTI